MRVLRSLLLAVPLCASAAAIARADSLPDPGPWEACDMLKAGAQCFSTDGSGYCVEMACPNDPMAKCLYCDPNATATTGAESTGAVTTTASTGAQGTTAATGGSSGAGSSGASDGETSDGTTTKKESGCGCRSDGAPAGALALLGLLGLRRRRRG